MSVNAWYNSGTSTVMPGTKAKFDTLTVNVMDINELDVVELVATDVIADVVNTDVLNVEGNMIVDGSSGTVGQIIQKTGALTQNWVDLVVDVSDLDHGTAHQILSTNSGGTAAVWSSTVVTDSLQFMTDGSQSALNYYSAPSAVSLFCELEDASVISVDCHFQRVGNVVTVRIPYISHSYAAPQSQFYRQIDGVPARFRPTYGADLSNYTDVHTELLKCRQVNTTVPASIVTTGVGYVTLSGLIRIFTNYDQSLPITGTVISYVHTFCYSVV